MTQSGLRLLPKTCGGLRRSVLRHDRCGRLPRHRPGAAAAEFGGNEVAGDGGAGEQDALARRGRAAAKASSRPSATYSLPIRSTFRCSASTAARVAGPMAQMLRAQARAGRRRSGPGDPERTDAVGAGEDQPVVRSEVRDGAVERARSRRRVESRWSGNSTTSAPSARRRAGERVGLSPGAGHHDALAEQRQVLVPVELLAQAHHLADDDGGRRLHAALAIRPGSVASVPVERLLIGPRGPAHGHRGRLGDAAVRDQLARRSRRRCVSPMKMTSVSTWPTFAQSIASTSWPVTKVTAEVCSRCVSGTPV